MKTRQLFPLGKAYGIAFCNRSDETKRLIGNVENGKHTFLLAPRRYGKSSLCEQVFSKIDFSWSKLDFHLAITEKDAERIIIHGVTELIGKSIGSAEKLVHVVKKYAKKLNPIFSVGNEHLKLELTLSQDSSPAENIAEAILILEKLLRERNKQAALLLDEFQEIGLMDRGRAIEGAIRHAAQETQQLAFIFSGSSPHILKTMFEDERRPLYKLCRKVVLDRISPDHYRQHLNQAAISKWHVPLDDLVLGEIMLLSERHPYYVNYLCDELWSDNDMPPTIQDVRKAWQMILEEERSDVLKDFFTLTENQRRVMVHIANYNGRNLYSTEVLSQLDLPTSSVTRAIATLVEKDYIEKIEEDYRFIAPVYKYLLKN